MCNAPKQYKLQYLPLFWNDLHSAATYITHTLHNPTAANRMLDETENKIFAHLQNPTSASRYRSNRNRPIPYYWFPVKKYMVFYVVFDGVMEVRRFLYCARDFTNILP